jgi:hypothetical protein
VVIVIVIQWPRWFTFSHQPKKIISATEGTGPLITRQLVA